VIEGLDADLNIGAEVLPRTRERCRPAARFEGFEAVSQAIIIVHSPTPAHQNPVFLPQPPPQIP